MRLVSLVSLTVLLLCAATHAADTPEAPDIGTFPVFTGDLSTANYKVLKTNLVGKTTGFWFTVLPILVNGARDAINRLVQSSAMEGMENVALINVVKSTKVISFIVGTLVITEVRADLIQFMEE